MVETEDVKKMMSQYSAEYAWPSGDTVRDEFSQREHLQDKEVADIIDDCVVFKFLRRGTTYLPQHEHPLIVTARGRHLLLKLGLLRELAKDNSEWFNIAAAFSIGLLTAAGAGYFAVRAAEHAPPPAVKPVINIKTPAPEVRVNNTIPSTVPQ